MLQILKPVHLEPMLHKRKHLEEKPRPHKEEQASPTTTGESLHVATDAAKPKIK